jgi:hypothetical protein
VLSGEAKKRSNDLKISLWKKMEGVGREGGVLGPCPAPTLFLERSDSIGFRWWWWAKDVMQKGLRAGNGGGSDDSLSDGETVVYGKAPGRA